MSLFLVISFQTPLKNPTRRAGGTKASGFVPPTLRVGFLRGVIILWRWVIGIKCNKIEKLYTSQPSQGYLHPDYSVDKEKHGDQKNDVRKGFETLHECPE